MIIADQVCLPAVLEEVNVGRRMAEKKTEAAEEDEEGGRKKVGRRRRSSCHPSGQIKAVGISTSTITTSTTNDNLYLAPVCMHAIRKYTKTCSVSVSVFRDGSFTARRT